MLSKFTVKYDLLLTSFDFGLHTKCQWFSIVSVELDYDKDGFIGQSDLKSVIEALTRNELTPEEHQQIADKVIEEADVDGDGKLSFLEFDHVVTRAPDFLNTFHIRL